MMVLFRLLRPRHVARYCGILRTTKDDGRYSLTSRSHLSQEALGGGGGGGEEEGRSKRESKGEERRCRSLAAPPARAAR
jgi:hypothetical protein